MVELALSLQGFERFHNGLDGDLGINSGALKHIEALLAVQSLDDRVDAAAQVSRARVDDVDFLGGRSTLIGTLRHHNLV